MVSIDSSEVRHLAFDLNKAPEVVQVGATRAIKRTLFGIESDAEILVAKDTGNLANSISTDVDPDGLGGEVGPTADYGDDVEYGTEAHVIRAHDGGMLRFEIGGHLVFVREVHHPGTAPQPYMRPATDRNIPLLERLLAESGEGVL